MSNDYIKKQVDSIKSHSERITKSISTPKQKIQNSYDELTKELSGIIDPTIKVSELREWLDIESAKLFSSNETNIRPISYVCFHGFIL